MPTNELPKSLRKLIASLAEALYRICKDNNVPVLIILEDSKNQTTYTTGDYEEYEGRIEELADAMLDRDTPDFY